MSAPQDQGIQNAPPAYPVDAPAPPPNEKSATPQYPQQAYAQFQQPPYPQQQHAVPAGTFLNATPLASLSEGSVPVDCPFCGVRELTATEKVNGTQTQYVGPVTLEFHVSQKLSRMRWIIGKNVER